MPSVAEPGIARPWAVRLCWTDALSAASLRLHAGIVGARDGESLWVRGDDRSEATIRMALQLPAEARFEILPDGQLIATGGRVPLGRLPALDWRPLDELFPLEIPPAALPCAVGARAALRLCRSETPSEPSALLIDTAHWRKFGTEAPAVRLKPLSFAVCRDGRCLVRGTPVPPLPGTRLVDDLGVLTPVGFGWDPALDAAVVRQVFRAGPGELILCRSPEDGEGFERIAADQFVRATRSAVRRSTTQA